MFSSSAQTLIVDAVIVARDRAGSLAATLSALPRRDLRSVIVVDNGSTDATALVARDAGAVVLFESDGGYGGAARRAVSHLQALPTPPDAVVFLSADGSDDPTFIPALLEPLSSGNAELVVARRQADSGARVAPPRERLAMGIIGVLYRHQFGDLGRFRAIRFPALIALGVSDRGEGWNVEMQVKALRFGLRIVEVPVICRISPKPQGGAATELKQSVSSTGRMLLQILRHATAR